MCEPLEKQWVALWFWSRLLFSSWCVWSCQNTFKIQHPMFLSQHSKLSQSHAISFPMTVRTASGVLSFLLRKCVRFAAYERDKQTVVELNCSLPCTTSTNSFSTELSRFIFFQGNLLDIAKAGGGINEQFLNGRCATWGMNEIQGPRNLAFCQVIAKIWPFETCWFYICSEVCMHLIQSMTSRWKHQEVPTDTCFQLRIL